MVETKINICSYISCLHSDIYIHMETYNYTYHSGGYNTLIANAFHSIYIVTNVAS